MTYFFYKYKTGYKFKFLMPISCLIMLKKFNCDKETFIPKNTNLNQITKFLLNSVKQTSYYNYAYVQAIYQNHMQVE